MLLRRYAETPRQILIQQSMDPIRQYWYMDIDPPIADAATPMMPWYVHQLKTHTIRWSGARSTTATPLTILWCRYTNQYVDADAYTVRQTRYVDVPIRIPIRRRCVIRTPISVNRIRNIMPQNQVRRGCGSVINHTTTKQMDTIHNPAAWIGQGVKYCEGNGIELRLCEAEDCWREMAIHSWDGLGLWVLRTIWGYVDGARKQWYFHIHATTKSNTLNATKQMLFHNSRSWYLGVGSNEGLVWCIHTQTFDKFSCSHTYCSHQRDEGDRPCNII